MKKKSIARMFVPLVCAALLMASCELAGVTPSLKSEAAADSKSISAKSSGSTKIYCTASLPPKCFFFEFDLDGDKKTARVLLPLSSDSYIQGDKILRYSPVEYAITSFSYDPEKGSIAGETAAYKGVSYSFAGTYLPAQGFFGSITKIENGVAVSGRIGGVPIAAGSGVSNYVGEATYLFETEHPQTLIFNVAFNPDTGLTYGSWCESGETWDYSIHGSIGGSGDSKTVHIKALPFDEFNPYLLYPMSAEGDATFQNPTMRDIAGTFDITYGQYLLPSLITATKETR